MGNRKITVCVKSVRIKRIKRIRAPFKGAGAVHKIFANDARAVKMVKESSF